MRMREGFCGWYFKCQSEDESIALIPAVHTTGGQRTCSIQILSAHGSLAAALPGEHCHIWRDRPCAVLGGSLFSESGIRLDLHTDTVRAAGSLRFGAFSPLRYDIMGPFSLVPAMECRHSVASMRHSVDGHLRINGRDFCFRDGVGYLEGDRGRSFPRRYAWTQCCFDGGSLMLAVADVPLGPVSFTGVLCVIQFQGREYRLATYLGARAASIRDGTIVIRQAGLDFTAALLDRQAHPLQAPIRGAMTRIVRENVSCRAFYRFRRDDRTLFAFVTPRAAFEYGYP